VTKYYEAIRRSAAENTKRQGSEPVRSRSGPGSTVAIGASIAPTTAFPPVPVGQETSRAVARMDGIQLLTERLAPLAVLDGRVRLLVSGCRPGDGASTVSMALAIDLSQRLSLRTMLVDAHMRHPSLHNSFPRPGRGSGELVLADQFLIRPTGWPRLDLATFWRPTEDQDCQNLVDEFENLATGYSAAVIDLGVVRLDAQMLPLARPTDPIMLIARYGHTERRELATTACALRAANRTIAGVILNAATDPVTKSVRRLMR
jgi:tyrosine-protein kinase